ncbi:MAG: ABC transporter permease subunit [Lachnospiraceae bacterium]|nr:ABC transporter permease subunit [Lachnospiraceae bacterium]
MGKRSLVIKIWAYVSMAVVVGVIVFLFGYIFIKGVGDISMDFLTQSPKGVVLGQEGGIYPAITGSIFFTLTAVVIGAIPAIATALWVVFYCKSQKVEKLVHAVISAIAGIPSIVLGLFAYSLFVRDLNFGRCILSSGIALGIMILPFIEIRAEKAFLELPKEMILAVYALGCSKAHAIVTVVLPGCITELFSGVILGGCYAMGATAPMIFTGAVAFAASPKSIMEPAMALPMHLYLLVAQGTPSLGKAYGTAFVMMMVILISNVLVTIYARRRQKAWNR